MKVLCTICGRAGSKGIKNKNIREFNGKPLVYYTLAAYELFSEEESSIDTVLALNTDSPELVEQIKASGVDTVFVEREEHLAGDVVAKIDVIKDTLYKVESITGETFDYVIDMDITSPIRSREDIGNVLSKLIEDETFDVAFSVTDARRNPHFNMVHRIENGGYSPVLFKAITTRQAAPVCYDMNASIYAYRTEFLREAKNIFDGKCAISEMIDTGILDIDNAGDFELMEYIYKYFTDNFEGVRGVSERAHNY